MQTTSGTSLSSSDPDEGSDDPRRGRRRIGLFVVVAVLVYATDVATKIIAVHALAGRPPVPVVEGFLTLRLTHNPGAAFSLGTSATFVLSLISIAVVVVVVWLGRRVASPVWAVALGSLLGGAAGNLTDRVTRAPAPQEPLQGHVVDFLELPNWPVFNVADSAIVTAAALIIMQSFRGVQIDGGKAKS